MRKRLSKTHSGRQRAKFNLAERRSARLWVRSRARAPARRSWRWVGGALLIVISLLSAAVVLWAGLRFLERCLLSQNDLFRIQDIKIECSGEAITAKHVMDYAQLAGLSNIFAFSMAKQRDFLLKTVPRVKAVKISRRLPGELNIEVVERIASARLEMKGYFLSVDHDGCVLGAAPAAAHLPLISGAAWPGIRPGTRLAGTAIMDALQVLEVSETTNLRDIFQVQRIDLRKREALDLTLASGERVTLAWQYMGTRNALAREHLEGKLFKLGEILKVAAARGKRIASIDMTLENNFPVADY